MGIRYSLFGNRDSGMVSGKWMMGYSIFENLSLTALHPRNHFHFMLRLFDRGRRVFPRYLTGGNTASGDVHFAVESIGGKIVVTEVKMVKH